MEPIHMLDDSGLTLTSHVANAAGRAMTVTLTWPDPSTTASQLDDAVTLVTDVLSDWADQDRAHVTGPPVTTTRTFGPTVYRLIAVVDDDNDRVGYYDTAPNDGMTRVETDMWVDADGLLWTDRPETRHARHLDGTAIDQTLDGPSLTEVVGTPVGTQPTRAPGAVPVFVRRR